MPYDCSVELSPKGYQFLTDIFETFDKVRTIQCITPKVVNRAQDQDGALKTGELEDLFSTSPGNPWAGQKFPDTTVADDTGAVTLQGWLAQWRCGTMLSTIHG